MVTREGVPRVTHVGVPKVTRVGAPSVTRVGVPMVTRVRVLRVTRVELPANVMIKTVLFFGVFPSDLCFTGVGKIWKY